MPERVIVIIMGAVQLFMFFLMRSGRFRSWFIAKPVPGLITGPMSYLTLIMGIVLIASVIMSALPNYDFNDQPYFSIFFLLWVGGPFLGFYWAANPPRWLQPRWVRWLDDEYGYCLHILIEEAQKGSHWKWEKDVHTQEGLQRWVDSVYERRKVEIDLNWQMFKRNMIIEQQYQKGFDGIKWGMRLEGHIPEHRLNDAVLTKEEMSRVARIERENRHNKRAMSYIGPETRWD